MDTQNQEAPFQQPQDAQVINISRVEVAEQNAVKTFDELVAKITEGINLKAITKQLAKLNYTLGDKATYDEIKKLKNKLTKVETAIEETRVTLKEPSLEEGRRIDNVAKGVKQIVTPQKQIAVQKLKDADDLIIQEQTRIEEEKKQLKSKRITELESNGCPFTGQWWSINDISLGVQQIEESTDEQWSDMIAKVKVQNEKNIQEATAKKEKEEEANKEQEILRLENEKAANELKEQQKELRRDQLEALGIEITPLYEGLIERYPNDAWKAELEKLKAKKISDAAELKLKEENEAKQKADKEKIAINAKKYEELGFKYDFSAHLWYYDTHLGRQTIHIKTMLDEPEQLFEETKKLLETIRIEKLKSERNAELKPYIVFIRDYNKMISLDEADYKKELSDIKEAARLQYEYDQEQQRIAKQNDTDKYNEWIDKMSAITRPQVSDERLIELGNNIIKLLVKQ